MDFSNEPLPFCPQAYRLLGHLQLTVSSVLETEASAIAYFGSPASLSTSLQEVEDINAIVRSVSLSMYDYEASEAEVLRALDIAFYESLSWSSLRVHRMEVAQILADIRASVAVSKPCISGLQVQVSSQPGQSLKIKVHKT